MKFGFRTPSLKKSFKARTTGRAKRAVKKSLIPGYGKKGMGWIKNPKKVVVVDTMPEGWFAERHIPGAINSFAPLKQPTTQEKPFSKKQVAAFKKDLVKKVKEACTEKVTVKGKNGKKKTVPRVNYKKKVVVYCGFVKCTRSHIGAQALVKAGFKNVYRHPGGISAWIDAGYAVEGTDAK